MKNRQMKMVILILVGLVLFTASLALLLYSKEQQMRDGERAIDLVEVYVSAKDIQKGDLIEASSIKKAMMPREFVTQPLTASEILGRYAQVNILKNEPIRSQKIGITKPQEQNSTVSEVVPTVQKVETKKDYDTITIPLSAFKNIDATLTSGDKIDIVSVQSRQNGRTVDFSTKYVALGVTIDSFIAQTKKVTSYVAGYNDATPVYAQSIVLRISPKEVKNFFRLYYKTLALNENRVYNAAGHNGHLWIVKCAKQEDEASLKAKERMLADYVSKVKKSTHKVVHHVAEATISYEK